MTSPLSSPLSPTAHGRPHFPLSSRLGHWFLTAALLIPAFFVLSPASFGVPNPLRSLGGLFHQVGLLGRAELGNLLFLLIFLSIFSFLYTRQVRFLISEYYSSYPLPAPPLRFYGRLREVEARRPTLAERGPTLAERRRRNALTPVIIPKPLWDSLSELRSPTVSRRED